MPKIKASDLKNGNLIRFNKNVIKIEEINHRTPGNLRAFYQAKMRNINTGKVVEHRFRTDEEIELCQVETKNYQVLYKDGTDYVVMDQETFEQFNVAIALFGESAKFIKEEEMVTIALEETTPLIGEAPLSVVLEVTYTEPAVKGDTSSSAQKYATVETGVEIKVPIFINEGDKIKIDTRTGAYIERAK